MKNSEIIFISFLVCLSTNISFAQGVERYNAVVPPSPNASALMEYVNVPVDYYTGVPDINVPLYTLPGRDINIPVGVSYHASGIKVQDVASSTGLGWNLYAGGAITRMVRGLPDGQKSNCWMNGSNSPNTPNYWGSFVNGLCDHEPDIFYFNFLGQSGKFVLDENLIPYQMPGGYSKISPIEGGVVVPSVPIGNQPPVTGQPSTLFSWKITDENGYQYFFGENSNSRELSTLWKTVSTSYVANDPPFISTWYLTKIISPKGVQVATFTYLTGSPTQAEYFSTIRKNITSTSCPTGNDEKQSITNIKVVIENPLYISTASTSLGTVNFYFAGGRLDLANGLYLSTISISNSNSQNIKNYNFQYGYFIGLNCKPSPHDPVGLVPTEKRLKLLSIKDNSSVKIREFIYNESVDLPQRNSVYIDHWGYYSYFFSNYNTLGNHTRIPKIDFTNTSTVINGTSSNGLGIFSGGSKFPDANQTQANILTQIKYPTGGSTVFNYEGNLTANGIGGGIRIQSISDKNEVNIIVGVRTYSYEQGKKYRDPVYHYLTNNFDLSGFTCIALPKIPLFQWCFGGCDRKILVRHSSSLSDLFDLNGNGVGYGKVTETLIDNSRTERFYSNFDTRVDGEPIIQNYIGSLNSYSFIAIPADQYGPPFSPKTSYAWERGLLVSEKVYSSSSKILAESQYNYDFNLPAIKNITCKSIESSLQVGKGIQGAAFAWDNPNIKNIIRVGSYSLVIKPINLLNIQKTIYSQAATGDQANPIYPSLTSSTLVAKHPLFQNYVQSLTEILSDGVQVKTEYRYVFDVTSNIYVSRNPDIESQGFWMMVGQNNIATPVEVIHYIKKPGASEVFKVVGAELTTYKRHPTLLVALPYQTFSLQVSEPLTNFLPAICVINSTPAPFSVEFVKDNRLGRYQLTNQFTFDNTSLNVSRIDPSAGVPTSYEWGFNNSLVTATNVNVGANQIRTEYTNQPLIGLTSIKDANLQTVNYEFDKYYRLKMVRDQDNNVLQRYRYHYRNQNEFTIDFVYHGIPLVNQSLSFNSLFEYEAIGTTNYLWDFGDGTTAQGSSLVYHPFVTPGTYTVKLFKTNAEYGTISVSKQIVINPPPTVLISAASTNVDICSGDGSANLSATALGGCPASYSYSWYYQNGFSWIMFGDGANPYLYRPPGSYQVKCVITDACGATSVDSDILDINFYKSFYDCPTN